MKPLIFILFLILFSVGVHGTIGRCGDVWQTVYNQNVTQNFSGGSQWSLTGDYLYNNSGNLDLNETKLNETIDALDDVGAGGSQWTLTGIYLYNNSGNLDFNDTMLNATIDDRAGGNSTEEVRDAINQTNHHYNIRVNCSQVLFDNGFGTADICDGVDATTGGGGVNMWIDNGSFLSPNASYAANILVSGYIYANDWTNVTITESQISDLAHTTDTNTNCSVDNSCPLVTYASETVLWDKDHRNDLNETTTFAGEVTGVWNALVLLDYSLLVDWANLSSIPANLDLDHTTDLNESTTFAGEVTGVWNNLVLDHDALDDQYYDSEGDLTTLLDDNYVSRDAWTDIDNYPSGCPANYYVQTIGDTLTCVNVVNDTDTDTNTNWALNTTVLQNESPNLGIVLSFWDGLYTRTTDLVNNLGNWTADQSDYLLITNLANDTIIRASNISLWDIDHTTDLNESTVFAGEVTGLWNNLVVGNDVLDDQYYDSESDLTTLLDNNYYSSEGNLTTLLNDNYVDVTSDTMTGNLTVEQIHLEVDSVNHRIYDNAICTIIKGDISTLSVC